MDSPLGRAVAWTLSKTGVYAAQRKSSRNKACLICYPRVIPFAKNAETLPDDSFVRSDALADHLTWISKRFELIGLREFSRRYLTGDRFLNPTMIVAFEGGLTETYDIAAPLTDHLSVPATAFLPAAVIGTLDRTPAERLLASAMGILQKKEPLMRAFPDEGMPAQCEFIIELLVAVKRPKLFIELFNRQMLTMEPGEFDSALSWFEALGESDHPQSPTHLTWEQVQSLVDSGWEIGCQGASGKSLLETTEPEVEFSGAYRQVLSRAGIAPVAMLYPKGEFDEMVIRRTRLAGFLCGVIAGRGRCDGAPDLFTLPGIRINQGNAPTVPMLEKRIS